MSQFADIVRVAMRGIEDNEDDKHELIVEMMVNFMQANEWDDEEIRNALQAVSNRTYSTVAQVRADKLWKELKNA